MKNLDQKILEVHKKNHDRDLTVQNAENFKATVNGIIVIEMSPFKKNTEFPSCCIWVESPQQKHSAWTDHKQGEKLGKKKPRLLTQIIYSLWMKRKNPTFF